ncbi:Predicted transcriptional regulator YdeE, contains AraC-type DNA-binding domain [Paenibacillus sp. cl141a]|uniref:GyrI-like domain-containing protein n=1 Tax=Paenibacillus sp. cl141a TaxID=1761877 RepID=UPI0008CFECCC|nr:GyrI-like domain-containing protein [Paenibacillus sp. cl141a]SEL72250.1 Predicted transcriptional regulator YdeE, contains AraC-type DNA-binding domain [Paenibacillus sp. cl141a]
MNNSNQNQSERWIEVRPAMSIQGVGVRTTNEAEAGPQGKIPQLWDRYFQSGLQARLSDKDQAIYALYTDYESDASGSYTLIIGNRIDEDVAVSASSEELQQASVPASRYLVFRTRRGPLMEIVPEVWHEIWSYFQQSAEKRTYTGDYERFDTRQFDPAHTVVDVYIAIE